MLKKRELKEFEYALFVGDQYIGRERSYNSALPFHVMPLHFSNLCENDAPFIIRLVYKQTEIYIAQYMFNPKNLKMLNNISRSDVWHEIILSLYNRIDENFKNA